MTAQTSVTDLWEEFTETRSPELRDQLITMHLPLVRYVASRMLPGLNGSVDMDDLVGNGVFGLMDAVDRYDVTKNTKFSTFATLRIQGAMADGMRQQAWGSRRARATHRQASRAAAEIEQRLGRPATDEEIAEVLEVNVDHIRRAETHVHAAQVRSLNYVASSGEDAGASELGDLVAATDVTDLPQRIEDLSTRLAFHLESLDEHERTLLSWLYVERLSRKEVAQILGTTESWVCHMHTKAMVNLQAAMAAVA